MTTRIKHTFVSGKADGPDVTEVKPSDWNHEHDNVSDQAGFVLGRDTSGAGPIQELPLQISPAGDVKLPGTGGVQMPSGTSAQRLLPPVPGTIRYNTDLQVLEVYGGDGTASWVPVLVGAGVPVGGTVGWYSNTAPVGWVFVNGQTVGDDVSVAVHNTQAFKNLFIYLWNNVPASKAAVLPGGPGVDALTDWNAHKTIPLPDECGTISAGANNMGGIASTNRLTAVNSGVDGDTIGAGGGAPNYTMTADQVGPHTHPEVTGGHLGGSSGLGGVGVGQLLWDNGGGPVIGTNTYPSGSQKPLITQPRTIIKNVIIKY